MKNVDNYRLQVEGAKKYFLRYDQQKLIEKLNFSFDEAFLYTRMLSRDYRIRRENGAVERLDGDWTETNAHGEVMTLLDLVCDSREDRYPARRWQNMSNFSAVFHRSLMEDQADSLALFIQENQPAFHRACLTLGGEPGPGGDISYSIPFLRSCALPFSSGKGTRSSIPGSAGFGMKML